MKRSQWMHHRLILNHQRMLHTLAGCAPMTPHITTSLFFFCTQAWEDYFQEIYWQAFSENALGARMAQSHQWLTTKTNQSAEQTSKCSHFQHLSRCHSASCDVPFGFLALVFSASSPSGHCPSFFPVFFSSLRVALCVCGMTASVKSSFLSLHTEQISRLYCLHSDRTMEG